MEDKTQDGRGISLNAVYEFLKGSWSSVQEKYPRAQFITRRIEGVVGFSGRLIGYNTLEQLDDWVIAQTNAVDRTVTKVSAAVVPKWLSNRNFSLSLSSLFSFVGEALSYLVPSFLKSKKVQKVQKVAAVEDDKQFVSKNPKEPEQPTQKPQTLPVPEQWLPEADKAIKEVQKNLQNLVDGAVAGIASLSPSKPTTKGKAEALDGTARSAPRATELFSI